MGLSSPTISPFSFGDSPFNRTRIIPWEIRPCRKTSSPKSLSAVNKIAFSLFACFTSSLIPGSISATYNVTWPSLLKLSTIGKSIQQGISLRALPDGVNNIGFQSFSSKSQRCVNSFASQAWMRFQYLINSFASSKLFQDQFYSNARTGNNRLTHHNRRVGMNYLSFSSTSLKF